MAPSTAQWITRAVRVATMLALVFSGCTCSEERRESSAPAAGAPAGAPAAPQPTDTPPLSTPTAPAEPTAPSPAAEGGAAQAGPQSECQRYVDVFSGRSKDLAPVDTPEARKLIHSGLVMCGAVFSDSDAMCRQLMPTERGPGKACRRTWATFHEMRAYPQGRSFMFDEVDWEECRTAPFPGAAVCDAMREALRAGDAAKCDAAGVLQSVCRAFIDLDPSLCRLVGDLDQTMIELPDQKEGEGKIDVRKAYEEHCRKTIAERRPLAVGLEELARSSQPQQQELAKAALGRADACESFAKEVMEMCLASARRPQRQAAPAPAQPPAAPPPPEDGPPQTPRSGPREIS